ncbi:MAG: DUF3574 domain-containing protein [Thermales bacterium]|nr:DUF3574 domain-containing protein [Thermales bacterium]
MIYMGRDIYKPDGVKYVTDLDLEFFLNEQPYFDSFTIWSAKGSWRGNIEDTIVIEVFDTDFDIIVMFAQHYRATFDQEAVYIKISETTTELITE